MKLHLFNPENDLALALGCRHYTPPPHAAAIHRAGALLPMWWANDGDLIVAPAELGDEAAALKQRFGLKGEITPVRRTQGATADSMLPDAVVGAPWGWSLDAKRQLMEAGVSAGQLPTDAKISALRNLSHRRSSIRLLEALGWAALPVETTDADAVLRLESAAPGCYIKSPWSGSGRGVFCASSLSADALRRRVEGIIHRQGSVIVERGLEKAADLAALFYADGNGRVEFRGLSVFLTEQMGMYAGNVVASQQQLRCLLSRHIDPDVIDKSVEAMTAPLSALAGSEYTGWLGVDMMIYRDSHTGENRLMPCVEINLRMTMGVAALAIARTLASARPHILRWQLGSDKLDSDAIAVIPPSDGFSLTLSPAIDV